MHQIVALLHECRDLYMRHAAVLQRLQKQLELLSTLSETNPQERKNRSVLSKCAYVPHQFRKLGIGRIGHGHVLQLSLRTHCTSDCFLRRQLGTRTLTQDG